MHFIIDLNAMASHAPASSLAYVINFISDYSSTPAHTSKETRSK